jgi:hypothetical protein
MFTSKIRISMVTNKLRNVLVVLALLGTTAMALGAAGPASAQPRKCQSITAKYPACGSRPGSCLVPEDVVAQPAIFEEYEEGDTAVLNGDVYVCQGGYWYYIGQTLPPSSPVHVGPVAPIPPVFAPIP